MGKKHKSTWIKYLPASIQAFIYFLEHLKIKESQHFKKDLLKACSIFALMMPVGYWVVGALKNLLPGYLQINPLPLLNEYIFFIMLALTTTLFSAILFSISSICLIPKKPKLHHAIFNRSITVYAFLNSFIVVICTIMLNRLMAVGNPLEATSQLDLWIANTLVILAFTIIVCALIIPLGVYFNQYYNKKNSV
jgi:hypothetical protein